MIADKAFDKKFPFTMLGFESTKLVGDEHVGACLFCGKSDKLYINENTGQWSCKGGYCGKEGNVFSFIKTYYNEVCTLPEDSMLVSKLFADLSLNRGFSVEELVEAGVKWSEELERFILPVRNEKGSIVNLRIYSVGRKTISLTGLKLFPDGVNEIDKTNPQPVFLCEGEWDSLAMRLVLKTANVNGVVVCIHGSNVFAKEWINFFKGEDVYCCYDNDVAGEQGRNKLFTKLSGVCKSFHYIDWPSDLPNKFDLRDFYKRNGTYEILQELFKEYSSPEEQAVANITLPNLRDGGRPTFEDTVEIFEKHMKFTPDMRKGLKILFAISYASCVKSIPLWLHIVGPPGSGKTELLMSMNTSSNVQIRSTVTARSLVSGFSLPGGKDPSLLPLLFGKLFILKDYTEILQMSKIEKEEVDSILRGAYDGVVTKQFGNGIMRNYEGTFNMVTGVTQEIFREAHTSLGERYLTYHMIKGVGFEVDDIIRAALSNSGEEAKMRTELCEAAKNFVEFKFDEKDIPPLEEKYIDKIVSVSQIVSILRAGVARDFRGENILFNPQHEVGTRLAKQLKILLICLGMCNENWKVTEEDYQIVQRVALDSCKSFNLDIAVFVESNPGCTIKSIAEDLELPVTNIRTIVDDMTRLGVLYKEYNEEDAVGRPSVKYFLTSYAQKHWDRAIVTSSKPLKTEKAKTKVKFKKK